jgi:hypothetical protein
MAINAPRFTMNPPQINHQKTTFCTPFSAKSPAKTTKFRPKKNNADLKRKLTRD